MNKTFIGGIIAVVIIIGAGVYVAQQKTHDAAMMAAKAAQEAQTAMDAEKMHASDAAKQAAMKSDQAKDAMMAQSTDTAMKGADVMSDKAMTAKDDTKMMAKDTMMPHVGSYETYTPEKVAMKAAAGKVVLFFHASWCPTCRAVDADIKAHLSAIPAGLTILDVDYDASTDLKVKYGVTIQHTFVEVDAQGAMIKKWSGSPTLAALVAEVK